MLQEISLYADLVIGLAYTAIPILILIFTINEGVSYIFKKLAIYFTLFILMCGITHFNSYVELYHKVNAYWVSVIKIITAIVSLMTAYQLGTNMKNIKDLMNKVLIAQENVIIYRGEMESMKKEIDTMYNVREQFIANISHEMRTPLQGILGFSELLSMTVLNSEQSELLQSLHLSSRLLQTIINDILDITKFKTPQFKLENREIYFFDVLYICIMMQFNKMVSNNIRLYLTLKTPIFNCIQGDSTRIIQILNNILSNSIKFSIDGSIYITLSSHIHRSELAFEDEYVPVLTSDSIPEPFMSISIRDTGIGIPHNKIKYVFNQFQQSEETISRKFGGTGLGLYIIYELLRIMKGEIFMKSSLGVGTEIVLFVPTGDALKDKIDGFPQMEIKDTEYLKKFIHEKKISPPELTLKKGLEECSILVVEDNHINQMVIERMLKK